MMHELVFLLVKQVDLILQLVTIRIKKMYLGVVLYEHLLMDLVIQLIDLQKMHVQQYHDWYVNETMNII